MKVLLFDIDGTLLQAAPSGRLAFSDALREVTGIEDTLEEIAFHGQTDPIIWGKIRSKHGLDDSNGLEHRFFSSYEVHLAHRLHDMSDRGRLCPGIPALLQRLVAAPDVYLSILTGNIEAGPTRNSWRSDCWISFAAALTAVIMETGTCSVPLQSNAPSPRPGRRSGRSSAG